MKIVSFMTANCIASCISIDSIQQWFTEFDNDHALIEDNLNHSVDIQQWLLLIYMNYKSTHHSVNTSVNVWICNAAAQ